MNSTPPRSPVSSQSQLDAGWNALRWGALAGTVGPFFVAVAIFAWSRQQTAFFGVLGLGVLFGAGFLGVHSLRGNDPRIVLDTPQGARGATSVRGWIDQIPANLRHELVTIGQPVWWAVRGVIGAGGFFALFGATSVTVVAAIAGAAASIWIGRKTQQDRRLLWYVVPLNVVAAIAVPSFLAAAYSGASFGFLKNYNDFRGHPTRTAQAQPVDGLTLNGVTVSNIYPFDAQGKQISVRLYDQDGNLIALDPQDCANAFGSSRREPSNLFPQAVVTPDANGYSGPDNCKESTKAPFPPPKPLPTKATSPTPKPTARPSTPAVTPTR
ncbi:hypothetical protein PWY87_08105 [Kribbella solani]|uniref:hypothetical protein n=1 Tax=Kribbella solani TaxID=236067 RepID=UPI0029AFAA71|nr:hypothetical protein [Kribbella solani]MDX2971127.1 hypothetical protein [Kribbella solani]MDX3001624.1 hypothetical protein [Kribbella solani]